jgi:hypothetical protein
MANTISGIDAFSAKISLFKDDLQKKVAFSAALAGANVIKRGAISIATAKGLRLTGALINNIAVKRERDPPPSTAQYNLGVRHGRDLGSKARVEYAVRADGSIRKVYVDDPFYWWYLEFGTKPHEQAAPRGRRLALEAGGKTVFAMKVRNPGIQATPFIGPSFESNSDAALSAMAARVEKFIAQGAG